MSAFSRLMKICEGIKPSQRSKIILIILVLLYLSYSLVIYSTTPPGSKRSPCQQKRQHPVSATSRLGSKPSVSFTLVQETCPENRISKSQLSTPTYIFGDIILLIVFQIPRFEAIPYLELLYRDTFPNMVYCVPGPIDVELVNTYNLSYVMFPINNTEGSEAYNSGHNSHCVERALKFADENISGILYLMDDVMLHFWQIAKYPRDKIWYYSNTPERIYDFNIKKECRTEQSSGNRTCDLDPAWPWWRKYENESLTILRHLKTFGMTGRKCHENLANLTGAPDRLCGGQSLMYYLPMEYVTSFSELARGFVSFRGYSEIYLPTILHCLSTTPNNSIIPMTSFYNSGVHKTLGKPWSFYGRNKNASHIHPIKLSSIGNNSKYKKFFCREVFPYFYENSYTSVIAKLANVSVQWSDTIGLVELLGILANHTLNFFGVLEC